MSKILEIAELIEFLASPVDYKRKAEAVKVEIANELITEDEGLDLIIEYT